MKIEKRDVLVIGGGAAGMAAATELKKMGRDVILVERDHVLGGILNQCIHNGFGLHHFKEELTGPEYAERFADLAARQQVPLYLGMTVTEIDPGGEGTHQEGSHTVYSFSASEGMVCFVVKAVVLAMGCRERNRGNIGTPGTRPSGVYTAGLAQRLVNVEGYIPGKEVVIVGSGDIGLIMARRMTWVGAAVKAVVEIQPYPAGLTRNIVQCLNDFSIPLYLNHVVSEIRGKNRVEAVEITPRDGSKPFTVDCDTVLLSVGLVPDTEIAKTGGVALNPETGGPLVDYRHETSVPGIFACGNVLHVHDLVDYVTEESIRCAASVDAFIREEPAGLQIAVHAGANLKYVVPGSMKPGKKNHLYMRSLIVSNRSEVQLTSGERVIFSKRLRHVQPSEMIGIDVPDEVLRGIDDGDRLEIHLQEMHDE